eukprot:1943812-Pleurochrysis_carterae.AAC.1
MQCALRGAVWTGGEVTQTAQRRMQCRRAPLPYAVRVTRVVLGVEVACMAAAEAGVLQRLTSG